MFFTGGKRAAMAQVCLIDTMRVLVRIMMMPVAKVVDDLFVAQQAEETVRGSRLLTISGYGFLFRILDLYIGIQIMDMCFRFWEMGFGF